MEQTAGRRCGDGVRRELVVQSQSGGFRWEALRRWEIHTASRAREEEGEEEDRVV